jgi:hypothetical protein
MCFVKPSSTTPVIVKGREGDADVANKAWILSRISVGKPKKFIAVMVLEVVYLGKPRTCDRTRTGWGILRMSSR